MVPAADGFITGVRFYKGAGNTGTHTGTLYSASGSVLATGTFSNETATGWQMLNFSDGRTRDRRDHLYCGLLRAERPLCGRSVVLRHPMVSAPES